MITPKILLIYSCGNCSNLRYDFKSDTFCFFTGEQVDKYWRKDSKLGFPASCPLEDGINPNSRAALKKEVKEWIDEVEKELLEEF